MILVSGVSGRLGRAVFDLIVETDPDTVGGTRRPDGNPRLRRVDFDDPGTLTFHGVDTLVLISAGTAEDDVVIARHENVLSAAERDGVGHVVYTSVAAGGDHLGFALAHRWTERRLRRSTLRWTILRNGLYAELFGALLAASDGAVRAPFGSGALAAVARADLAEAAAAVARSPDEHAQRVWDLVGARAITARDVAEELGVPYVPESLTDRRARLAAGGLFPFQPGMLLSIHSAVANGFLDETSDDLERLLGRKPRDALDVAVRAARA